MASPSRRSFLRNGGVVIGICLGGCPGTNSPDGNEDPMSMEDDPGVASLDGEPKTVPESLRCDDESFERHFDGYDENALRWGTTGNYSLTSDTLRYDHGDSARFTLRYTGSGTGQTGNRHKFDLELFTEAGWQEVRGWSDGATEAIHRRSNRTRRGYRLRVDDRVDGIRHRGRSNGNARRYPSGLPRPTVGPVSLRLLGTPG